MTPEHVRVWNSGDRLRRQYLRRYWPELADALDIASVAEDFGLAAEDARKIGTELHRQMEEFAKQTGSCDGCKAIKRMEEKLPPNDEDAAYHFQRAARHHRKECPNR